MYSSRLRRLIVLTILGVGCCVFLYAPAVHAQVTYTQPLTNIPGITDEATLKSISEVGLVAFINGMMRFIIQAAAIASVVMIVRVGFEYLIVEKSPASLGMVKDKIWSLTIGIILIAGTWIILNTINPNITERINVLAGAQPLPDISTTTKAAAGGKPDDKRKPFSTLTDRDARAKAYAYADTIKSSTCAPKVDEQPRGGGRGNPTYTIYEVYCQPPN